MKYPHLNILVLAREHAAWSQATFGNDSERGPLGPLKHLEKEAKEAQESPQDSSEYADCLLLVLDAARRAGIQIDDLVVAAYEKLQINKARTWPAPIADAPVEHVKTIRRGMGMCTYCCVPRENCSPWSCRER